MVNKHAPGTTQADMTKASIATLPYEIQVAIFDAAMEPQVIFMDIVNGSLTFTPPTDKTIGLACQLSREIYCKNKTLRQLGKHHVWVDSGRDIFYLRSDDPIPRAHRPSERWEAAHPVHEPFYLRVVRNIAVDLQYLGEHPRHDAMVRIWSLFPHMRALHVLVPKGPPQTPALRATPEGLVLSDIPIAHIVAAPKLDNELWLADSERRERLARPLHARGLRAPDQLAAWPYADRRPRQS
ncbi:hypothetical protein B0I37DRAFT_388294 [Chaetomium sp. MPI-CAGE-AT-0009]|nr:hypothetical protein B0I37DRAFT_388294 [Chaetomium sp. MPI-CAGE-AT-0009]